MMLPPEDIAGFITDKVPFMKRLGLKVLEVEYGRIKLMVPLMGNENHLGTMYAGAAFTLAEVPGGGLFLSAFDISKCYPILKEMSLRFRRPLTGDAVVELSLSPEEIERIKAQVEGEGKADFILEGEVRGPDGEVAVISRGVYQVRKFGI